MHIFSSTKQFNKQLSEFILYIIGCELTSDGDVAMDRDTNWNRYFTFKGFIT